MQASRLLGNVPRPFSVAFRPASRPNQHDIAASRLESGLLLPCVEIGRIDRSPRLEPVHPLQARNVHQDASREDALLERCDRELGRSRLDYLSLGKAVVHLAVVCHMAQRVHVGMRVAVIADLVIVGDELAGVVQPDVQHLVAKGTRIVDGGVLLHVARHRDRNALFHELRRCHPGFRRDQIHSSELVVRAPAAPVRERFHPRLDIGLGHLRLAVSAGERKQDRGEEDLSRHAISLPAPGDAGRRIRLARGSCGACCLRV